MTPPARTSLPWLAAAGVASAFITIETYSSTRTFLEAGGLVFGMTLAGYFAVWERERSKVKLVLFVAACAATPGASTFAAARLSMVLHWSGGAAGYLPLDGMAYAGGAGTLLILMAALLLFAPHGLGWASLLRMLSGSLGGAVLALAGAAADRVLLHPPRDSIAAVFLLWQPGTALLMGLMLMAERAPTRGARAAGGMRAAAAPGDRSRWALAAIFLAGLLGFYGFSVIRNL